MIGAIMLLSKLDRSGGGGGGGGGPPGVTLPTLARIGEVRSMIPEGAHCLVLTETATSLLCSKIIDIIGLQNPKIIAVSPCKANKMIICLNLFT